MPIGSPTAVSALVTAAIAEITVGGRVSSVSSSSITTRTRFLQSHRGLPQRGTFPYPKFVSHTLKLTFWDRCFIISRLSMRQEKLIENRLWANQHFGSTGRNGGPASRSPRCRLRENFPGASFVSRQEAPA